MGFPIRRTGSNRNRSNDGNPTGYFGEFPHYNTKPYFTKDSFLSTPVLWPLRPFGVQQIRHLY